MNTSLWVLQILGALIFGSSGIMKVFLFDKVSGDVPSFGALPRGAWTTLGVLELVCAVGLVAPLTIGFASRLTVVAASLLAAETLIFVWVHIKYKELPPIAFSVVLGLAMAFVAYGRAAMVSAS